jgi:hypothetical protein
MLDPFDANEKIIKAANAQKGRPKSRIALAFTFEAATSPDWYIISVSLDNLPDGRRPQYEIYLYLGDERYDVERNMTVHPRDYFIVEAKDGNDADTVLIEKSLRFSLIDAVANFRRKHG